MIPRIQETFLHLAKTFGKAPERQGTKFEVICIIEEVLQIEEAMVKPGDKDAEGYPKT